MRIVVFLISIFLLFGSLYVERIKKIKADEIIVLKSKRKLQLYFKGVKVKQYSISLGGNPNGHKQFEGDQKTPEGYYFIDGKNPNSKYYKNLGISYPNGEDKAFARSKGKNPGGAIKIHGLPNDKPWLGKLHLLKDWTHGCIAVTNKQMDEIYRSIDIGTKITILP